jgi:uncharacterized protein YaiI (UPF0178 family)
MDFILPEYSLKNLRTAMESGHFFAVARYAKNELGEDFKGEGAVPVVTALEVDEAAQTITVARGADSADLMLVNLVHRNDIVVTQDYGLAALCLARGARPLDQNGRIYDESNIDSLLGMRHISQKIRRAGGRTKGPSKRTKEQDEWFEQSLEKLLREGSPE